MKLYMRYFSIHLKSQMQYKTSFLLTTLGQFLTSFSALLGIWFMMMRFEQVGGFSFEEVLLCFACVLMSFSLSECFFRGFDSFAGVLGNGEFDRIMVRPRGIVFQVLSTKIDFTRMGRLLQALLVFAYAIPNSDIIWTGDKIATLFLMIICGIVVFCSLFLVYASICFFTTEGLEVMNIFTDGGREFGRYPFSVYGESVLKFFTYVIPLALFQYYPLLYLVGKTTNPLYMLAPLVSLLFVIPCNILWRIGVKHFKSTGS